jgi:uncharacterized protein YfbU (UPF0304 family)
MSIRVEESLQVRVEEAAEGAGVSVSEWARRQIMASLGIAVDDWSAPATLSMAKRRQMAMLHRLLELASDDEDEVVHHSSMRLILQEGYTGEYSRGFDAIYPELPISDCRLVWDLLDMFQMLAQSVTTVGPDVVARIDDHAAAFLSFRGFDFNNSREGRMASYVRHLFDEGRWQLLADEFTEEGRSLNSHMPLLGTYQRMVDAYAPIKHDLLRGDARGRLELDETELRAIVISALHPDHR